MKTLLRMVRGDITMLEADAIVNSANNDLVLGGGVSGAIRRVAGSAVQDECQKIGTIPLGTAVATTGGQLKARWIIHAAVNPLGLWADPKSVRNATRATLRKAEDLKLRSLAFPAIGTGAGALPVERCADILIEEVQRHCAGETSIEEVMFVLYDEKPYVIFEERFKQKVPQAADLALEAGPEGAKAPPGDAPAKATPPEARPEEAKAPAEAPPPQPLTAPAGPEARTEPSSPAAPAEPQTGAPPPPPPPGA